jgi:S-adenosylmethionine:tRNA ribosyltransferase-isomerase
VSALAFDLPAAVEAREPPEARGLQRDEVRLMVARRGDGAIAHARFRDLPSFLAPGDLLVVNDSATLPAAVDARLDDGTEVELHAATPAARPPADRARRRGGAGAAPGGDWWVVELRTAGGAAPLAAGEGERVALAGGAVAQLVAPYAGGTRLWLARIDGDEPLLDVLRRHGRPIRYGYVPAPWPLETYQTVFARHPGSAEMPSAARPFTPGLVTRLVTAGVLIAPVTLHAGVSSPERHEPPHPERYAVPAATARLVNALRGWGGRVIAVGTTVVRALETVAAPGGTVAPGAGWTGIVVTAERGLRAVDGLLTGWHEPQASHLRLLEAAAGDELLARCYREALAGGYLWHEFGDSHLIVP